MAAYSYPFTGRLPNDIVPRRLPHTLPPAQKPRGNNYITQNWSTPGLLFVSGGRLVYVMSCPVLPRDSDICSSLESFACMLASALYSLQPPSSEDVFSVALLTWGKKKSQGTQPKTSDLSLFYIRFSKITCIVFLSFQNISSKVRANKIYLCLFWLCWH